MQPMQPHNRDELKLMVGSFGLPAVLEALSAICVENCDYIRRRWQPLGEGERQLSRVWNKCARAAQDAADTSREYLTGAKS